MAERCVRELGGARPIVGCQDRNSTCTRRCMAGDRRGRRRVEEEERESEKDREREIEQVLIVTTTL